MTINRMFRIYRQECVQQFFGIWRIYLNSTASRNKLIQLQFIFIKESGIKIYESNPFDHKYANHERILIKHHTVYLIDSVVYDFLNQYDFRKTTI